jgi:hypothetical protein
VDDEPLAHPVYGRSGLSDAERSLLVYITLRHVAAELHISDQEAADLLDSYAETGQSHIVGDRRVVSMRWTALSWYGSTGRGCGLSPTGAPRR